ncbi:putative carbonate dehydratase [Aspergillus udagawae]|uniref:Carbonic anhydrase n=1 Tax=Aspergillus udagawae TaxID=91492 RepID=A0ABQ1BDV8_9EURO|nr:putative carbonate dehydratase [Aspergillus udagawae]GFF99482.1 putative carbonate dehydratase [Aspergillus udagawae]GFG17901.1 putative carbonate dehydratase [Aspergillus udagawae]
MGEHIVDRYQLQPLRSDSVPWRRQPGQQVLWIGCSDSGCDELESLGLPSDEVFEYRSLGNMMVDDLSCNTALRYALDSLKIRNIVICGHYGCHIANGEVETTLQKPWSSILDTLRSTHHHTLDSLTGNERDRAVVELNVMEQVHSLSQCPEAAEALQKDQLNIWGMVYDKASKTGYQLVEA